MKRQLDLHGTVVARFCPTALDALTVFRRGAHREASCHVETIGLDLPKRESQLSIQAEDGTITKLLFRRNSQPVPLLATTFSR